MASDQRSFLVVSITLVAVFLAACACQKRLGKEELTSEIRAGRSVAAESELFVDFVIQGHSMHHYAREHSAYLEDLVQQAAKELEEAAPEPAYGPDIRTVEMRTCRVARARLGTIR